MEILKMGNSNGSKPIKTLCAAFLLRILGLALAAASKVDKEIRGEIALLPDGCLIGMTVFPFDRPGFKMPAMFVQKTSENRFRYIGSRTDNRNFDFLITFTSLEAALRVLTFRESTLKAHARNRFTTKGALITAAPFSRILNKTEILLLPKIIAARAVRRYDKPKKKHRKRICLYARIFTGI